MQTIQETRTANRARPNSQSPAMSYEDRLKELQQCAQARNPIMCPTCGDTRRIRTDLPVGHPDFGKTQPCPKCNRDALIIQSGINPDERHIRLSDLVTNGRPGAAKMAQAARTFIDGGFIGSLAFFGDYGNGKSTTMKAIANAAIDAGIETRYMSAKELLDYVREAFDSQKAGDTDAGRITRLASTRLLLIDEMDKARLTEYAREVQTHLFDVRYRQAAQFGTVVAWNGTQRSLELPWVLSRLSEYPMIENKDADMRPTLGRLK